MKTGLSRFWYRFKNWFRTKPGLGEPLTFLCGSEEELRRVTTWICHANPQLFQETPRVGVAYIAVNDECHGKGRTGLPTLYPPTSLSTRYCELLQTLCNLAWRNNQFTGTHWNFFNDDEREYVQYACNRGGFPRSMGIIEHRHQVVVGVKQPSAHERAEALLALSEWLDGKVSEQEKRKLLQLPDDFEF